jgi:cell division protein FtsB
MVFKDAVMIIILPLFFIALFFLPMFLGRGGWRHRHRMHRRGRAWGKIRETLDTQQREIEALKREIEALKKKE